MVLLSSFTSPECGGHCLVVGALPSIPWWLTKTCKGSGFKTGKVAGALCLIVDHYFILLHHLSSLAVRIIATRISCSGRNFLIASSAIV